ETERIFHSTRMPQRLQEMVDALGGDPVLVREIIARPALSGRLLRSRFASQPPAFGESFDAWWGRVGSTLDGERVATVGSADPLPPLPLLPTPGGASRARATDSLTCPPGGLWDNGALASPPDTRSYPTGVWTGSLFIVWGGEYSYGGTITRFATGGRYDPATDTWRPT